MPRLVQTSPDLTGPSTACSPRLRVMGEGSSDARFDLPLLDTTCTTCVGLGWCQTMTSDSVSLSVTCPSGGSLLRSRCCAALQYHIWDTVSTAFADIEEYSPTVPGVYTWPFSGAQGFYSSLYAGPLPPIQCSSSVPSGTVYKGCYADSSTGRTFKQDSIDLDTRESSTGMTPQVWTRAYSGGQTGPRFCERTAGSGPRLE